MCYSFFSLLSFCYHAHWSVNPWGTCFTWSHPHRVAFQFNQEPSWLLRYRYLAFSRFISLRQTTHESKTSGLKDSDIIHKILEQATPFFLYSINLELQSENTGHHKPSTNPWDGEFLYRITSYRTSKTICNTTWMNLCPNLESAHDSLTNRNPPKKVFPIPRKPNIQKKFRINYNFIIFINLISNPLLMVFVKFHNMKREKKF